jgi:hypothetical protein
VTQKPAHDDLLEEGPREAPEPETAEQRGKRLAGGGLAGGAVAIGAGAAKFGGLAKLVIFLFAWHGAVDVWRLAGWLGVALVLAAGIVFLVVARRRQS